MTNVATLVHLLEQRTASTPDADAYQFGEEIVSYALLRQQVVKLAAALAARGVQRGDRVGILLNRNLDMVRSVYAVLYAGAAYVPIDTTLPPLRAQQITQQCELALVISNSRCKKTLADTVTPLLLIDDASVWHHNQSKSVAHSSDYLTQSTPSDLAYIIFTSGSTGTPKGIAHSHSSAVSFATMMAAHYELSPIDTLLATSALHFDMSTFDLFAADYAGAHTVIASEAHQKMPASLTSLAEKCQATVWYSAPFAMSQALEYGALEQRQLDHLRWMIYAGEAFPVQQLNRLMAALPQCRFSNAYGPAETNVSHIYDFPWPNKRIEDTSIPIGKPCAQVDVEVNSSDCKDENQDVKEGFHKGELCIAANTLMDGYWQQDELTHAKIYTGANGRRYYRSGDIVSVGDDGVFYLLGRRDRQIKLRGFRIELEDVETILCTMTDVEQASVSVRRNDSGQDELVADILLRPHAVTTVQQLKQAAKQSLPVYAVPKEMKVRPHFPTTSSGKIDRQALSRQWQEQTA